ncbi:MAG: phenylalanine--tRNA ligase subunit beta [Candidatus Woesearchaeota archaeon]|jgi:phenylalanyl-tRNA synthetase beta chain
MKIPLNWLKQIVDLPSDVKKLTHDLTMVGHMLDKIEVINGEIILDLELRGNRADCYSILGIAREVSAIYGTKLKNLPIIDIKKVNKLQNINLKVLTPLVKNVEIIEIKNIKIEKSPKWLSSKLTAYGIETKNNIIDLTNYVMIETGEPMHAFDLDKIDSNLQIRLAKTGEKIITFMDSALSLNDDDLVWATNDTILSVAGAIGEKHHSISNSTKNILLEAANYDQANIRRTVYRHKLLTDAGIRHEKELDPNMVGFAVSRFLYFIKKYNWGEFKTEVYSYYPKKINPWKINLNFNYLNKLSSLNLKTNEIKKVLDKLQFKIVEKNKENLTVLIPTYRTDVKLEEDLIEEIIRIYGYDNIPANTLSLEIPKNITPDYILQEERLRNSAVSIGFDENISLSFIREKYLSLQTNKNNNVTLINPPSPEIKYLRSSLFPNLLESAKKIMNERGKLVQLFEIGKIYTKSNNKYEEKRKIGFIYTKYHNSFTEFKSLISSFFDKADINNPLYISDILDLNFINSYKLKLDKQEIGWGGKFGEFYYTEIDLDSILNKEQKYKVSLWPKYPPQIEDLTLVVPKKTYIGEVIKTIKSINQLVNKVVLTDIYENSYTFNIEYQSKNHTLNDREVKDLRTKILSSLKLKFGIVTKE